MRDRVYFGLYLRPWDPFSRDRKCSAMESLRMVIDFTGLNLTAPLHLICVATSLVMIMCIHLLSHRVKSSTPLIHKQLVVERRRGVKQQLH